MAGRVPDLDDRGDVGSTDGSLSALDPRDGTRRWRVGTDQRVLGRPAVRNDRVYAVDVT